MSLKNQSYRKAIYIYRLYLYQQEDPKTPRLNSFDLKHSSVRTLNLNIYFLEPRFNAINIYEAARYD